jgi:hypothetical protein
MDLLLGIGNSIPNGYIEDLCKEVFGPLLIRLIFIPLII